MNKKILQLVQEQLPDKEGAVISFAERLEQRGLKKDRQETAYNANQVDTANNCAQQIATLLCQSSSADFSGKWP